MRKFLISIALVSTAVTAFPAMAQNYGQDRRDDRRDDNRGNWNRHGPSRQAINELLRDLNRAESQIQRSVQRRIISPREAVSLRREANQIRARLNYALRGGLSGREFGELRVRVNRLEQRIRMERRDRDRRPG
ncbi:MAG TPA: hypothetical protein VEW71_02890 [Allosphingosinicella sp.]|nr:hypothetical protein [Allosphingosinicella sp.]